MDILKITAAALLAGGLFTMAGTALAQQAPPRVPPTAPRPPQPAQPPQPAHPPAAAPQAQAAPADQTPQRTTATYGDWVVRCDTVPGPPPQKNCDMEQLAQLQGQTSPISRAAIPQPPKGEQAKLFIQLPVNVSLAAPVRVEADSKDPGITTPFRRCVPAGCFAEIELKEELQKKFRTSPDPGKISFKDSADHDVVIPLSFKGFGQAFDALLKQ
ncbi:MAG TPA: invasion associated locus B family protein [Xanthobacteraceae bacterium]